MRRLQEYPHKFALLSLGPITGRPSELITFRAKRTQGKVVSEKLLNGYLTQFGPMEVVHHFALRKVLQLPSAEQAATVVVGRASKQYIGKGEWNALTNCTDLKTVNALVEECSLSAIAAFHVKVDETKYFIKLRVRTEEVKQWLQLPFPCP